MSSLTPDSAQAVLQPTSLSAPGSREAGQLPLFLTPFIGRESEIVRVCELLTLPEVRQVTLTGPGGVGKTRLALAIAKKVATEFADGDAFVDLSPVHDPEYLMPAIAHALGIRETAGERELDSQLQRHLAARQMLLVLDNCEQVIAAASKIGDLLAACPDLNILATSRAALGLSTEHLVEVPPLRLPDNALLQDLAALATIESVELFVRRAQAANPTFILTDENAAFVLQICARLEGLPLSLELAAARIKMLSPQSLLARLERRLPLLVSGRRDAPDRQRTLRETLAWSYDLLTPDEQLLFRRLCVFSSGFTLEAIEAMTESLAPCPDDRPVHDIVESLITQSLVRYVDSPAGDQRFTILETIREYALEQLEAHDETAKTRQAHANYFLALSERGEPELTGPDQTAWFDRFELEHDNIREALGWLLQHDAATALRLSGMLWRFWWTHGHLVEGRRWLEQSLASGAGGPGERAKALCAAGGLALEQGDYATAEVQLEESLVDFRRAGDKSGEALALNDLGLLARDRGQFARARALYEEGLLLRRAINDNRGKAIALCNIGVVAAIQGDYELAEAPLAEAAETFRQLNDPFTLSAALTMQADLAGRRGDYERSIQIADEAIQLSRQLGDPSATAIALITQGDSLREQGTFDRATQQYQEALMLFREASHHRGEAGALYGFAALALDSGDVGQALPFLAENLRLLGPNGDQEQVACALEEVARAAVITGEFKLAVRIYGSVAKLREVIGVPRTVGRESAHQHSIATARAAAGPASFESAEAEGRSQPLEEVIADAIEFALLPQPVAPADSISDERITYVGDFGLTPRELEVLKKLAAGLSNQEIADSLHISLLTVKTHVARILSKLDLPSRAAAAAFAHRHRLN
jgi:predicted ATPase/DNA-binding CsgD family transcriptional regulator